MHTTGEVKSQPVIKPGSRAVYHYVQGHRTPAGHSAILLEGTGVLHSSHNLSDIRKTGGDSSQLAISLYVTGFTYTVHECSGQSNIAEI